MPERHKAKVLVTGASGMLGLALRAQLAAPYEVVGVSKTGRLETQACDLSDERQVRQLFLSVKPDWVVHSAAYSDVDGCEQNPELAFSANALSTKYLAAACSVSGAPLIYVSTDYVFDGRKREPYTENDLTGPVNVYGMTKLAGESYAKACVAPSATVRTSWLFGDGNPNTFVSAILKRLKSEKRISVLEDQQDSPTFTKDLAQAIGTIGAKLLSEKKSGHRVFQICNRGVATRHSMTLKMKEWLALPVQVDKTDKSQIPHRFAIRPAYGVMSTRAYEEFSGERLRPWEEALREYVSTI